MKYLLLMLALMATPLMAQSVTEVYPHVTQPNTTVRVYGNSLASFQQLWLGTTMLPVVYVDPGHEYVEVLIPDGTYQSGYVSWYPVEPDEYLSGLSSTKLSTYQYTLPDIESQVSPMPVVGSTAMYGFLSPNGGTIDTDYAVIFVPNGYEVVLDLYYISPTWEVVNSYYHAPWMYLTIPGYLHANPGQQKVFRPSSPGQYVINVRGYSAGWVLVLNYRAAE